MNGRAIDRLLEAAGVPEGARPPYRTTMRLLFATALAKVMRGTPDDATLKRAAADARVFVASAWHHVDEQGDAGSRVQFRLHGDHVLETTGHCSFGLKRGNAHVGGGGWMPSVRRDAPVISISEIDAGWAAERAEDVVEQALALARPQVPAGVVVRRQAEGVVRRWTGATIEAVVDGVPQRLHSWNAAMLAHLSNDTLLAWTGGVGRLFDDAEARVVEFLARVPDAQATLDDAARGSGLPVKLRIGRHLDGGSWPAGSGVRILMDGYGPSGMRASRLAATSGWQAFATNLHRYNVERALDEQRRLHDVHGPAPLGRPTRWILDVVTARMLADTPDGAATIARALATGEATGSEGTTVRIAAKGVLRGKGRISDTATWHGDELRIIGIELPQTVMAAAVGRPAQEVIDSPMLEGAGPVKEARADRVRNVPRVRIKVDVASIVVAGRDQE